MSNPVRLHLWPAFLFLVSVLILVAAQAQPTVQVDDRPPSQSLVSWIENNRRTQQYLFPGVSIVVIKNYQIKWAQGFGFSNQEKQLTVTPQTLFQAASISKPVTAVAAMLAFKQHNLSINEPINTVFKTFSVNQNVGSWLLPNPSYSEIPVSLKLLLSHRAGTNDFRLVRQIADEEDWQE
jgi:CubicO group peptidase (beta-lactamase class C family)